MRICASQCVSLLFHPVGLYSQSFWQGIQCNIQSLLCVQLFGKFAFNESGAVRALHLLLRVIHLLTRICGPEGVSPANSFVAFLYSKTLSDPFLFSNFAYHNILLKHFLKALH